MDYTFDNSIRDEFLADMKMTLIFARSLVALESKGATEDELLFVYMAHTLRRHCGSYDEARKSYQTTKKRLDEIGQKYGVAI